MYAADNDADVINMSLQQIFRMREQPGHVAVFNRAINYATDRGTVVVVAAGNDSRNMDRDSDTYQAYCQSPGVVCVSATGPTSSEQPFLGPWENVDAQAPYSNYGSPITVAAPGGSDYGFVLGACSGTTLLFAHCREDRFLIAQVGTSFAAPHVSGLAALLVEDIGKNRPSEVAAQIRKSADDLGKPGKDAIYGQGRINVAKALKLE